MKSFAAALVALVLSCSPTYACVASWYGHEMHGRNADGSPWRPEGLSIAHRSLPFGTLVEVCYRGACRVAPVKDRGPAPRHICADLSQGLARAIGMRSNSDVSFRVVSQGATRAVARRRYGRRVLAAPGLAAPGLAVPSLLDLFK
jgi:rare lipoprotein A